MGEYKIEHRETPGMYPDVPQELRGYIPQVEKFITDYQQIFWAIAQDRSLQFHPSSGFHINLKKGRIGLGVEHWKWAEEKGFTEWGRVWAVGHEIAHFEDLKQNPEAMLENFHYMRQRAKQIAPEAVKIIAENNGGKVPDQLTLQKPISKESNDTMSQVELFIYDQLHRFYNVLDDMYVNQELALRSAIFAKGGSQEREVQKLYKDVLYPSDTENVDYTKMAKCLQFGNYILRKTMVPDQEITISPVVLDMLHGYTDDFSREKDINLEREIRWIVNPGNKKSKNPQWRYSQIKRNIEPKFVSLLLGDIADFRLPEQDDKQGDGQEGKQDKKQSDSQGDKQSDSQDEKRDTNQDGKQDEKGSSGDQDEKNQDKPDEQQSKGQAPSPNPWQSDDKKPESIDEKSVQAYIDQKNAKEKAEKKQKEQAKQQVTLSPEDRHKQAQDKQDAETSQTHGIDPKFAVEYRDIEQSIEKYKTDLARVFEQMMNTLSYQVTRYWAEGFRSGKFNVDSFIAKYSGELAMDTPQFIPWEAMDVYDQREFISRLNLFPDQIRVRLVLDGSVSMDETRMKALKQLTVLFLESLSSFETTMNYRYKLQEPFVVDTEIHIFGDEGKNKIIKPFRQAKDPDDEKALRFQAFGNIHNQYGATCDAESMWKIAGSLDPSYLKNIKEGKAKEFVFVITDGGSNRISEYATSKKYPYTKPASPEEDSKNAKNTLEASGILTRGFQIGNPDEEEQDIFNSIWHEQGRMIPDPKDLAQAVADVFKEELLKTQILIASEIDES